MGVNLCIDIGGTRIKAVLFPENINKNVLQNAKVIYMNTLGWMNGSLHDITNKKTDGSIINKLVFSDEISNLFLSCPFDVNSDLKTISGEDWYVNDYGVKVNFPKLAAHNISPSVNWSVSNDALAWARGYFRLNHYFGQKLDFPTIIFALGTGIAVSKITSSSDFRVFNLRKAHRFDNVSKASGKNIVNGSKVHGIVGYQFYDWVKKEKRHWDYSRIKKELSKRFAALLSDFLVNNYFNMKDAKDIIICGGNSAFISESYLNKLGYPFTVKKIDLLKYNVEESLVTLLGCIPDEQ